MQASSDDDHTFGTMTSKINKIDRLTLSQTSPSFYVFALQIFKSFENTVGKGEITHNEQFLLFPQCFLPVLRAYCRFQ